MKPRSLSSDRRKTLIKSLIESPTYRKAYQDWEFLGREELRPMRLQLELLKPEMALTAHDIRSTIIVFGSARIPAPEEARRRLLAARADLERRPRDRRAGQKFEAAQRLLANSRYYDEARKFSYIVSRASQADKRRDYVMVTGGGPGIMEAANRGAFEASGHSIGLNITLPTEQEPNPYITPELCFRFHYFAVRKMHFLMRAKAMVAFPGGFGTLDELFETLTLVQTGKKRRMPILLFGKEFWSRVINFHTMAYEGVISMEDMDLIHYVETAAEAWDHIRRYWKQKGGGPDVRSGQRRSLVAAHLDDQPMP